MQNIVLPNNLKFVIKRSHDQHFQKFYSCIRTSIVLLSNHLLKKMNLYLKNRLLVIEIIGTEFH